MGWMIVPGIKTKIASVMQGITDEQGDSNNGSVISPEVDP
jgi:hypothetical protein